MPNPDDPPERHEGGLEEAMQRLASPVAFVPRVTPVWADAEAREIWARIDYARKTLAAWRGQ